MNPWVNSFNSVRGRVGFLVAGLTCATLTASLVLVLRAYQQQNEAVARQLQSTARALAVGVDIHVRQAIRVTHALAASPELRRGDWSAFETLARKTSLPNDVWIYLADIQGHQLVNTRLAPGTPLSTYIVDEDLAAAMKRGETYISNYKLSASKRPFLSVSVPVDQGRKILTVAHGTDSFSHNLSLRRMVGDNLISIVDRAGVIAARSRLAEKYVGEKASPQFWKAASASNEGVIESVTLDGVSALTAFKRSELSGWTMVHSVPKADAYASARKLLILATLLSALLLCAAVFIARWIGHGLVAGVTRLVDIASLIGRGDSPQHPDTGLVETNYVAQALCSAGDRLLSRERELRELNQTLEHRISTRTNQLIVANQELAATNRELAEFARVAAHDLREPLRTINGFSTSLAQDYTDFLPPLAHSYTERISSAARRMNRLLDGIAAYSHVSHAPRVSEPVDLNQTLKDVRSDLEARLSETGGEIHSADLASVTGDPRELHQMLLNLIGNGLKFCRAGVAPVVRVETIESAEHVRLVVTDNGIGFDSNLADQLFVPFHRLENAREYDGTGMGLAIVRRIAERNGGSVRAVGTPGVGSRFEVTLTKSGLRHAASVAAASAG